MWWVCFFYSAQFRNNRCRTEVIPKLCGCIFLCEPWATPVLEASAESSPACVQHHVLVDSERAGRASSGNRMLLWAGGCSEAAFPPGSGLLMPFPYVTLCFAVVFYFSLLFFSFFLPHIQAGYWILPSVLNTSTLVDILGSVQTHSFVSAVMLLKTATF